MRNPKLLLLVFVNAIILCTSCKKDYKEINTHQNIYFQYSYINYAWGYQHIGWYLDTTGSIYVYNNPNLNQWKFADSIGNISSSNLTINLGLSTESDIQISKDTMHYYMQFVQSAAKGKLSIPENTAADAGLHAGYALIFDNSMAQYRSYLLAQTGDFTITNESNEAKQIEKWLQSINQTIQK